MHTSSVSISKKPFPWRCSNCLRQTVHDATVDYVATRVYDGIEYTIKIDGLKTPRCSNCRQVCPDSEALEVIESAFTAEQRNYAEGSKSA